MRVGIACLVASIVSTALALAEPPRVKNAQLEIDQSVGFLPQRVSEWAQSRTGSSWLGWHVPLADVDRVFCCGRSSRWQAGDRVCKLEGTHQHLVSGVDQRTSISGQERNLAVLLRTTGAGRIDGLRAFSEGCQVDAGGQELVWLEGVDPEQSVALLADLINHSLSLTAAAGLEDEALMALALHGAASAPESLTSIARSNPEPDIRGDALFWLAHTGAPEAPDVLLAAVDGDADVEVRDQAIFALSQLPAARAVPILLEIVQDPGRVASVRREAFFWLVQTGDDRALYLIAEILAP